MKKQNFSIRIIVYSMISTLLILTLIAGFIVSEKNTRSIGFADNDPLFIYKDNEKDGHYIGFKFMGKAYIINFSPLCNFTNTIAENIRYCIDKVNFITKYA